MANFFNEERHTCECGSLLFTEEQTYILVKEDNGKYSKTPYAKLTRCVTCGKIQDKINIKGE